jgi:cell division protein FtsQ
VSPRALERLHKQRRAVRRRIQSATAGWILAALVLLAGIGVLADRLMDPTVFRIREVTFKGRFHHLTQDALKRAVAGAVDANYFAIDLTAVERAVESLDWVQHAQVRRVWPDGLRITVKEQHLVARWGNDAWLNDQGRVVKVAAGDPDALRLSGPDGTGRDVLRRARSWAPRLEAAGLELKALTLNDRRAWYAVVAGRGAGPVFSVALGKDNVPERFNRFIEAMRALPKAKESLIDHVDARYPNGIALRLKQATESKDSA